MRLVVEGTGSIEVLDLPSVLVDGANRSAEADVEQVDLQAFDDDGDGDVDRTSIAFTVGIGTLGLTAGQLLELDVMAFNQAESVSLRTASRVVPHVEVTFGSQVVLADGAGPVHLQVEWSELLEFAGALVVRVDGFDVTSMVGLSVPEVVSEDVVGDVVVSRVEDYELDLSALAGYGLEGLPLTIEAWAGEYGGGITSDSSTALIVDPGELDPCHETALAKFCKAIGLSKGADGAVCTSADAAALKKAADDLQSDLAECEKPFPKGPQTFTCNGVNVSIEVGGTGQDVTNSDKTDAVIAIGGDGSGSGEGGDGKAVNTQPGGAAIGIGGDGGSGTTSGGNGGDGSGTARNGQNGTPPGCASGIGGDGGSASPPHKRGGNGGDGFAKTSPKGKKGNQAGGKGSSGKAPSGSNPGTAGTHGGGGWTQVVGGNDPSQGNFPTRSN